jgi:hypothetical protein
MSPPDSLSAEKSALGRPPAPVSFWFARIWQGMTLPVWLQLLTQHRFRIAPSRRTLAGRITLFSVVNAVLTGAENIGWGEQIKGVKVAPPLFVIGHWRTGTTWLHELLALDDRFSYPTTYQCSAPGHFLSTQDWLPHLLPHMMPKQRPMDNMPAGWNRPQEDEFALCNLGLPSPYRHWAFPNAPRRDDESLTLRNLPESERRRWQRGLLRFLQHLTLNDARRLILKSPTHTARIALLRELFPGAQFIHIVRDPYVVFPSTMNLWKSLWSIMGMQVPDYLNLTGYVFDLFNIMYRQYFQDAPQLSTRELCEVRYEDLGRDLKGEMRRIYDQLGLGGFERVEPKLQGYLEQTRNYQTNKFELDESLRRDIVKQWSAYFERYAYDK